MRYAVPFNVVDGVIYDAAGNKVKLWGVNYHVPFNHNFFNIQELGKDHFAAIDEDIRHFKLMGVEFIRAHLYDREITDCDGNVVENGNMRVFDYLVDQCEQHGIYLMLTPVAWWNTVKNQVVQERQYAYWFIDAQDAFGFSNYYSCDSMLWDTDAIKCQQVYIEQLFSRRNACSGKRLPEYANVVAVELFNEPRYLGKWLLEREPEPSDFTASRGAQRRKLLDKWAEFSAVHRDEPDEDKRFSHFRAELMKDYFDALLPIVDAHFGKNVLKAQFSSYSGLPAEDLRAVFERAGIDAYTLNAYLCVNGFDSECADSANHLSLAKAWHERIGCGDYGKFAKIAYEFNAVSTLNGYPLAAIAALFAEHEVQLAAYFTYTPAAVAAWNPGWLTHFLSLPHTPSRAAGFAAAGEIFRNHNPGDKLVMEPEAWHGSDYAIERANDFVYFKSETTFRYSNNNEIELGDASMLTVVSGRGQSRFASCDGDGFYHLEKLDGGEWRLTLFPRQQFVADPLRGKACRFMANRYVNCLKEPPVSILKEDKVKFQLKSFVVAAARDATTGASVALDPDGSLRVKPGEYILEVRP